MTRDEVQALFRNQRAALDRSMERARATVAEVAAMLPMNPPPPRRRKTLRNMGGGHSTVTEQLAALERSCDPRGPMLLRAHDVEEEPTAPREVELWSPLPPSWNRVFKARAMPIGGGKFTAQVYKTAEAKEYTKAVAAGAAKAGIVMFPKGCMLRFSGVITMERAGCDIDDRLKVYFDALNGVVFEDDEQVAELSDVRRKVGKSPGIQAVFTPIPVDRYGDPL